MKQVALEDFAGLAGTELGPGKWFEIDQARVNQFADATEDHQFIHVDAERAAQTPFGGTIAHGFLTLSLIPHLSGPIGIAPAGAAMTINYGSDKVRFLNPVRVGQRVRLRGTVLSVTEKKPGQWLQKCAMTVEIEGEDKPALLAETLMLFFVA